MGLMTGDKEREISVDWTAAVEVGNWVRVNQTTSAASFADYSIVDLLKAWKITAIRNASLKDAETCRTDAGERVCEIELAEKRDDDKRSTVVPFYCVGKLVYR